MYIDNLIFSVSDLTIAGIIAMNDNNQTTAYLNG